jgi:hypothetical protein
MFSRSYAESLGCDGNETSEEILTKLRLLPAAKLQVTLTIDDYYIFYKHNKSSIPYSTPDDYPQSLGEMKIKFGYCIVYVLVKKQVKT